MGEHIDDKPFPRFALVSAATLIGFALLFAATARLTDIGATRLQLPPAVASASLNFVDIEGGIVGVIDASTGREIERYTPGKSGFVRVVLRSFAFNRARHGISPETPFILSERTDGTIVLEDPATEHVVKLDAFGHGNLAAFHALLSKGKQAS